VYNSKILCTISEFSNTDGLFYKVFISKKIIVLRTNVKRKVKCTLIQAVRPTRGVELQLYRFLTTAPEGVRGQFHTPAALYPRETSGTHCTEGWVGPTASLDRCGKCHTQWD